MVNVVGQDNKNRLDLLLVNPPSPDRYVNQDIREIPAYGLGILATILKNKGYNVGVLDAESQPRERLENIIQHINNLNPHFVGLGINTPGYLPALEISKKIKEIPIILGGVYASALPRQTAEDFEKNNLYLIVKGPAEESIADIVSGKSKEEIAGACFFDEKDNYVENPQFKRSDIESYFKADRSFFINDPIVINGEKTSFLLSSRGCYRNCTFCSVNIAWNQKTLFRDLENVLKEMSSLYSSGVTSFKFLDDLFITNTDRAEQFLQSLKKTGIYGKVKWTVNSRVDIMNRFSEEEIQSLKEGGCAGIGLGLESANDWILKKTKKGFEISEATQVIDKITSNGIKTYGYFIIGFPGESENDIKNTILYALGISDEFNVRCGVVPYKLYPGTSDFFEILGDNPSQQDIKKIIHFSNICLTEKGDPEQVKLRLLDRERHTVIHDPKYFNPSSVSPDIIKESIRSFYLKMFSR